MVKQDAACSSQVILDLEGTSLRYMDHLTVHVWQITPLSTMTLKSNDNLQCLNDETPSTSSQHQNNEEGSSVPLRSKDMCASIIAKLLGSGVPNTVVLSTKNLEEFVGDLQSNIQP